METKLERISQMSREHPEMAFTSIGHLINAELLKECHEGMDGRKAVGMQKGTHAMLELLDAAKKTAVPAKYVLFDSWFSSPSTLHVCHRLAGNVYTATRNSCSIR